MRTWQPATREGPSIPRLLPHTPRGKGEQSRRFPWDFILPRVGIALRETKVPFQSSAGLLSLCITLDHCSGLGHLQPPPKVVTALPPASACSSLSCFQRRPKASPTPRPRCPPSTPAPRGYLPFTPYHRLSGGVLQLRAWRQGLRRRQGSCDSARQPLRQPLRQLRRVCVAPASSTPDPDLPHTTCRNLATRRHTRRGGRFVFREVSGWGWGFYLQSRLPCEHPSALTARQ